MTDSKLLSQIEHISDVFARIVLKSTTADLAGNMQDEITMSQFQALKHVTQHGPCTIGQLAEGLGISQPAATMLIDRMAKRGLVERHPGSSDRRRAEISLSHRAEELLVRIEAERADRLSKTLALMPESDRRKFAESMESFVSAALKLEESVDEACLRCGTEHQQNCIVNQTRLQLTGRDVEKT